MLGNLNVLCNYQPTPKKNKISTDLEKQLHEQYAINANHNLTTMITIAVAALSVIGVYGYVLIHTMLSCECLFIVDNATEIYSINTLLLTSGAVLIVLTILFHISLHLGSYQRNEQFITFAIRCKYYAKIDYDDIFPKEYNPFYKSKCEFVQGLHNTSLKIYLILYVLISVITIIVSIYADANGISNYKSGCRSVKATAEDYLSSCIICMFILTIIITSFTMICNFNCKYRKYLKRQMEFLKKDSIKKIYTKDIYEEICKEINKGCIIQCLCCINKFWHRKNS